MWTIGRRTEDGQTDRVFATGRPWVAVSAYVGRGMDAYLGPCLMESVI